LVQEKILVFIALEYALFVITTLHNMVICPFKFNSF